MKKLEIVKETQFGIVVNPEGQVKASDCMYAEANKREIERSLEYGQRYMNFQELKEFYGLQIQELKNEIRILTTNVVTLTNENVILNEKCESYENHIAMLECCVKGETNAI